MKEMPLLRSDARDTSPPSDDVAYKIAKAQAIADEKLNLVRVQVSEKVYKHREVKSNKAFSTRFVTIQASNRGNSRRFTRSADTVVHDAEKKRQKRVTHSSWLYYRRDKLRVGAMK